MSRPLRADALRNRQRILDAADAVFAEYGPQASTEEVARRAGVAIGTVFRHFPTKADLLTALMKQLLQHFTDEAARLREGDPATALREFFTLLVDRTVTHRGVVALLAAEGVDVPIGGAVGSLAGVVTPLLECGQRAGTIRGDVGPDEVIALLVSACQGALTGGWSPDLRRRTLAIIFDGLA